MKMFHDLDILSMMNLDPRPTIYQDDKLRFPGFQNPTALFPLSWKAFTVSKLFVEPIDILKRALIPNLPQN